jgi:hypothetical protein
MFEVIAGLVAKIASASTVAQATAGLGIAVAGVTGAGAAGVLPGPVQDTVAGAVQAITPFDLPHSADRSTDRVEHPAPASRSADDERAGPSDLPSPATVTAAPSATPEVEDHDAETEQHEQETEDGTHQNRGGRTTSTAPGVTDSGRESTSGRVSDDNASSAPTTAHDDHGGDSGSSGSGGSRHGGDDG